MVLIHSVKKMKINKFIYYTIALLYCIVVFTSCKAEIVDDPKIAPYVKDLYIENADQSKVYYIRQIRRNVNGTWLVSIGSANSILEDKSDGSSQVLVYSLGRNVEKEKVLPLTPINGFKGFGYISLDWEKIPEGREIICRSKINSNGYRLRRGGNIDHYFNKKSKSFSKSLFHDRFEKLERVKTTEFNSGKKNADYIITVKTQQDFDNLNGMLKSAINSRKKNIVVDILDGKYIFKESHLELNAIKDPVVSITLKGGDNTILIGSNDIIAKKIYSFNHNHTYLSTSLKNKHLWTDVKQMKDTVEVVDKISKLCRIKSVDPIPNQLQPKCKIKVTEWFKTLVYDVLRFENGYIYFYAGDLSFTEWLKCYSVNQDWGFGQKYPRYCLFYEAKKINEPMLDCSSSLFLNVENCMIKSFSMSNIRFKGNALKNPSLISIRNVNATDFRISKCDFSAIRSKVVDVINSQNVILEDNQVEDCYIDCFVSDNKSVGFVAKGNTFKNNGLCMNNSACVIARGKNFCVSDNFFCDFSYAAISVGMNYQWKKDAECYGIIENNEIHYSSEYFNHAEKYTLMDGGAIYVMTQLDDVIVRYNRIYDYCGVYANRGIFCDDGTKNISIYGNVITNVPNSFSIDLRLCPQVASRVSDHNRNIMMMYNLMDGKYRFEGVDKNSAFLGTNFLISKKFGTKLENVVSNVSFADEDYYMEGSVEFGAKNLILQSNSRNIIMQSPIRTYISRYIK